MSSYGRSRQSIADIEQELHNIFERHPHSHINDAGEPVIPANALVDVFSAFSEVYNGVELMTKDETDMLKLLLASNQGLEVTPQILLGFIAEKTKHSPHESPQSSPSEEDMTLPVTERGRADDRYDSNGGHSRSSSNDSSGTSVLMSLSRPSSRGPPQTPTSAKGPSPFDTSRRQRSTPLGNSAPSSWTKRPAPAHRRKSDAGSRSDSESFSTSPSSFGRTPGRTRAPSNPTSPGSMSAHLDSFSPVGSPSFSSGSRPHSRARSQPQSHFNNGIGFHYGSTDGRDSPARHMRSPGSDPEDDYPRHDDDFMNSISSLPMPRSSASDSDSDDEESGLGLVLDRSAVSSTASLEPMDRVEALQRTNAELGRKLMEAERTLQNTMSEHELELEENQSRLEEVKSELSATKREEKELRSKERQNSTQIAALESEIAKLQKSLDNARASYQSLQKQYQEQCAESERYRNTLRRRDQEIKDFQDAAVLQSIENNKWAKEHDNYEERLAHLEGELAMAQQAHAQLDEQKQENLMLKETIDRMRFDMDEMRNNASSAATGGSSGGSSAVNSVSKSLGAELLGKMRGGWGMEEEDNRELEEEEGDNFGDLETEGDSDGTEGEDVIQTIITRKKRKVGSRANRMETRTFEELKEYSDAYTQHEPANFTTSIMTQTDPEPNITTSSFSIQTDELVMETSSVQTDPPPILIPRVTIDTGIQTDESEPETSRSPSPPSTEDDETTASSSSTVLPPTPKAVDQLHPNELPPAYNQITEQDQDERDWRVAAETLKKWHKGVKIPFEPLPTGISEEAVEEWKAFKEELGIECMVIDKIITTSEKTGQSRPSRDGKMTTRRGRFYNIYNTYVYGAGKNNAPSHSFPTQFMLGIGATALVVLAVSPYMVPHYAVPGGPTYYDRTAWHSFNSMQAVGEGFSPDGTAAVWNFLGRVGGGAARIARGWPT